MEGEEKDDSILHQALGELMRRDISVEMFRKELHLPEVLKREIKVPETLKREIPVGDFLGKEISLKRKTREQAIEQVTCYACGKETPGTVSHCLHCEAPVEHVQKKKSMGSYGSQEDFAPIYLDDSSSIIDIDI